MSLEGLNLLAQHDEQEMQAAEITDYYEGGHCAHPRQNQRHHDIAVHGGNASGADGHSAFSHIDTAVDRGWP